MAIQTQFPASRPLSVAPCGPLPRIAEHGGAIPLAASPGVALHPQSAAPWPGSGYRRRTKTKPPPLPLLEGATNPSPSSSSGGSGY